MKANTFKLGLAGMLPLAAACSPKAPEQPNIVFFLVDDMGWVDSEVAYGQERYPFNNRFNTPNMNRLASMGVIMENAYACPVSTPTRTSMISGVNAAHLGITNWTSPLRNTPSDATGGAVAMFSTGKSTDEQGAIIRPLWNLNGVTPYGDIENAYNITPMPQILKDAGYYTIHVGKAHWASAGTPGASPYNMGFTVNVAGNVAGMPTSYLARDHYGNKPETWNYLSVQNMTEYYDTDTHLTEALTLEALKTLEYPLQHGEPFYLYMAHYATHTPIQPDDRFVQKYRDAGMDEGQARYASMVEGVDKSLGDIMDFLEARGVLDNTVFIFMTDNGGNSENKQKGGILHTQNSPLREGKGSCYEGGIRVPMMFVWPGKIAASTAISNPVSCEDMFPTILSFAGVKNYNTIQSIDGVDLTPMLIAGSLQSAKQGGKYVTVSEKDGGVDPMRPIVMHYPHKWKPYDLVDIDFLSCVRVGDWKLVYRIASGELELYNLIDDIGESNNVAAQYPEKTAELATVLSERLRAWEAPMPRYASTGKPLPLPDEL